MQTYFTTGSTATSFNDTAFYGITYERGRYATRMQWKMGYLRSNTRTVNVPEGSLVLFSTVKKGDAVIDTQSFTVQTSQQFQSSEECWYT